MDSSVEIVASASAREVLRDGRGTVIGVLERQGLVDKVLLRDARGTILGSYEARSNTTRDASGKIIGKGNLLMILIR